MCYTCIIYSLSKRVRSFHRNLLIRDFRKIASPFTRSPLDLAHSHHPMSNSNATPQLKITCERKQCSKIGVETMDVGELFEIRGFRKHASPFMRALIFPVRRGRGQANWRIRDSRAETTLHCNFRVPFALNSLFSKHGEEILCTVSSGATYSIDPLCRRFLVHRSRLK